ncbi:MAG: PspC domain-containing protein [candidate division Zixibacteria bacterium]|nr:PspC domain-containing protein [candidate division Zixibacteria bacterium]
MEKKLYRSIENRKIAGICGGLGEYFDIDPVIVRIAWVVFLLAGGAGIPGYILAWIIIPEKPAGQ